MDRHLTEDDLVLYRYQESPDAAAVERHLAACQQCRTEFAALERVLGLFETTHVPDPPPSYERDVWIGVQQRLAEPQSAWRQFGSWFRARLREPLAVHAIPATPPVTPPLAGLLRASWMIPQATLAAAIVALLVGSFAIDHVLQPVPSKPVLDVAGPHNAPEGVSARDRVLIAAVGEHLQRSELMLTEFNNADSLGSSIDLSAQQAEAEDLINENRLYRQSAAGGGQAQMASLLDDLERVLIEVAHAPASASPEELERMRTRLDTRDVLFKVRVAGAGLRAREDVAAVVAPSMSESGSGL